MEEAGAVDVPVGEEPVVAGEQINCIRYLPFFHDFFTFLKYPVFTGLMKLPLNVIFTLKFKMEELNISN